MYAWNSRLAAASFAVCVACWWALSSPWLLGGLTIPYDAKAHFHAQLQFLANALHSGQSPFWAPNVFGGSPQIADPQSLIFSPAILLALIDPAPSFRMVDAYVLGLLGLGGFAILLLFRDRGWHPAGGVVAALAFAFGASASWRVQHIGQIQSYVFFAVALWLLARAIDRRSAWYGAGAGLAAGLMMVEPDQVALLGAYVLGAWVATHVLSSPSPRATLVKSTPALVAGTAAGAAVVSIPLLLTYLFVESSSRPGFPFDEVAHGSLHPASLLTAVIGDLYGALDPKVEYWGPSSVAWDPKELMLSQNMGQLYVGALPMLLILTHGVGRGLLWAREIRFFTIATIAVIIYGLGSNTPLFWPLYEMVPGVALFRRPADATFVMGALFAILGGYLVHRWTSGTVPPATRWQRVFEAAIIVAIFAVATLVSLRLDRLAQAVPPMLAAAGWIAAAAVALWLTHRFAARSAGVAVAGFAALLTADLAVNNGPNESTALPVAQYDILTPNCQNETIRLLKAKLRQPDHSARRDRVELVGMGFEWPNAPLVHGFDHVLGYNPLRLNVITQAVGAGDTVAGWEQRRFTPLMPSYRSTLADLLGLRYIASGVPIERIDQRLKPGDLRLLTRTKDGYLYENPRALPRAMFVDEWMLADFDELIRTGKWPQFDPSRIVLLEAVPPVVEGEEPTGTDAPATEISIETYENTVVEIDVTSSRAGFVLLNDVWHPWWRATVDGRPAEILKANVLFRAVPVPAGQHTVRFEFTPFEGAISELVSPRQQVTARTKVRKRRPHV